MKKLLAALVLVLTGSVGWAQTSGFIRYHSQGGTISAPVLVSGSLGPELVSNGTFTSDLTGWAGAAWAWDAGTARHTAGTATDMTQAGLAAVVGTTYKTSITITAAAGGARINFGGVFTAYHGTGTFTDYITAKTTDALAIYPDDSAFNGTVDNVSVKVLTLGTSSFDGAVEFHAPVTVWGGLSFADGKEIAIGRNALATSSRGTYNIVGYNIGIGEGAGAVTTTGHVTAVGWHAGVSNTTGVLTAFGKDAGRDNTDGHASFFGWGAGKKNTSSESVCVGDEACGNNLTGQAVAIGYYALTANTANSVGIGYYAGAAQPDAAITAVGYYAGKNTTGYNDVVVGGSALETNTSGDQITAMGYQALWDNTTGDNNTCFGYRCGGATGANANTTGGNNTYIGALTGANSATQRTNTTMLGYNALSTGDNQVSLGNSSVKELLLGATAQSFWGTKTLTDAAAAVSFVRIAVPTNANMGGRVIFTATSTDGGIGSLTRQGEYSFAGADDDGTVTCGISAEVGAATAYARANTLLCTMTAVTATTNCDLQMTCTDNKAGNQTVSLKWALDMPSPNTVTAQ